jgi:hypothetical protein
MPGNRDKWPAIFVFWRRIHDYKRLFITKNPEVTAEAGVAGNRLRVGFFKTWELSHPLSQGSQTVVHGAGEFPEVNEKKITINAENSGEIMLM